MVGRPRSRKTALGDETTTIGSDAHAPGQLEWQPYGCARAAEAEVPVERIVNTWEREPLLDWTGSHQAA